VKKILGIESSCDECSAAVLLAQPKKLEISSVATFSQVKIHQPYGGVVPEIASRNHLETINLMVDQALKESNVTLNDIDAISVTNRPGLVGALLVGVSAAKALAYAYNKPIVPVHHLEGHASSIFLDQDHFFNEIQYPLLIAIISGGHTNLYLAKTPPETWEKDFLNKSLIGKSRDDAAGEAFDKTAKLLGFPYPGGIWIDKHAKNGDKSKFNLPRALPQKSTLDYSFSGLKTAASILIQKLKKENKLDENKDHLSASIQEAIVDMIIKKIILAIDKYGCKSLAIVGGVAANSRLRERLRSECLLPTFLPKKEYCTDNAAMIAAAGYFRFNQNHFLSGEDLLKLNAFANPEF